MLDQHVEEDESESWNLADMTAIEREKTLFLFEYEGRHVCGTPAYLVSVLTNDDVIIHNCKVLHSPRDTIGDRHIISFELQFTYDFDRDHVFDITLNKVSEIEDFTHH